MNNLVAPKTEAKHQINESNKRQIHFNAVKSEPHFFTFLRTKSGSRGFKGDRDSLVVCASVRACMRERERKV